MPIDISPPSENFLASATTEQAVRHLAWKNKNLSPLSVDFDSTFNNNKTIHNLYNGRKALLYPSHTASRHHIILSSSYSPNGSKKYHHSATHLPSKNHPQLKSHNNGRDEVRLPSYLLERNHQYTDHYADKRGTKCLTSILSHQKGGSYTPAPGIESFYFSLPLECCPAKKRHFEITKVSGEEPAFSEFHVGKDDPEPLYETDGNILIMNDSLRHLGDAADTSFPSNPPLDSDVVVIAESVATNNDNPTSAGIDRSKAKRGPPDGAKKEEEKETTLEKAHTFMLKGNGPLKYTDRNYIALIAASRFKCFQLIDNQAREFIEGGGDPSWLRNLNNVPLKLRALQSLNKLLAHQPWLIDKTHIQKLTKGGSEGNWSLSELIFAIAIMTHFHSLCSLIHGCAWLYNLDSYNKVSSNDLDSEPRDLGSNPNGHQCSNGENGTDIDIDENIIGRVDDGSDLNGKILLAEECKDISENDWKARDQVKNIIERRASGNRIDVETETNDGTVDALIVKMKKLHQSFNRASQEEMVKRYEKVVELSSLENDYARHSPNHPTSTKVPGHKSSNLKHANVNTAVKPTKKYCATDKFNPDAIRNFGYLLGEEIIGEDNSNYCERFVEDPHFGYQDFAKRGDYPTRTPTFRIQDYTWEHHGFSLVSRLCSDLGPLLDDKFKTAYHLTYSTMGKVHNVDTSMFRRAIWNYIHCMYGIRHDDYDYGLVNQLLARNLKRFVKTLACFPERLFDVGDSITQNGEQFLTDNKNTKNGRNLGNDVQKNGTKCDNNDISRARDKDHERCDNKTKRSLGAGKNNSKSNDTSGNNAFSDVTGSKDEFMKDFQESEKVHVNLMIVEAKIQAQMLYALRAIMQYMT
ncbi:unnamed protein product [Gordionus sp. m RMFG-2023]